MHLLTLTPQAFYLGIRKALLHPALAEVNGITFARSASYADFPSTKIDALLKIVEHHLKAPGQPPLRVHEEGSNNLVPDWDLFKLGVEDHDESNEMTTNVTLQDGRQIRIAQTGDRIVIYLAFPMNNWIVVKVSFSSTNSITISIVRQALEEAEIAYVEINGSISPTARTKALAKFKNNPDTRVLLLSGVGMVGLNIAFANILIVVVCAFVLLIILQFSLSDRTPSGPLKRIRN